MRVLKLTILTLFSVPAFAIGWMTPVVDNTPIDSQPSKEKPKSDCDRLAMGEGAEAQPVDSFSSFQTAFKADGRKPVVREQALYEEGPRVHLPIIEGAILSGFTGGELIANEALREAATNWFRSQGHSPAERVFSSTVRISPLTSTAFFIVSSDSGLTAFAYNFESKKIQSIWESKELHLPSLSTQHDRFLSLEELNSRVGIRRTVLFDFKSWNIHRIQTEELVKLRLAVDGRKLLLHAIHATQDEFTNGFIVFEDGPLMGPQVLGPIQGQVLAYSQDLNTVIIDTGNRYSAGSNYYLAPYLEMLRWDGEKQSREELPGWKELRLRLISLGKSGTQLKVGSTQMQISPEGRFAVANLEFKTELLKTRGASYHEATPFHQNLVLVWDLQSSSEPRALMSSELDTPDDEEFSREAEAAGVTEVPARDFKVSLRADGLVMIGRAQYNGRMASLKLTEISPSTPPQSIVKFQADVMSSHPVVKLDFSPDGSSAQMSMGDAGARTVDL